MYIRINSYKDINNIILVSKIVHKVLNYIYKFIKPGISTGEIDYICYNKIVNYYKAYPASLGYMNYPKSICTSINDIVCHGIPRYDEFLKDGDIINIDISICKNNYYSDASKMYLVGNVKRKYINLCKVTKRSLLKSLKHIKPGNKLNLIGNSIQNYIDKFGYSVVREYCGHGIGKKLHEDPFILHYKNNYNISFKEGMIFTVEPMINIGSYKTKIMKDGWTVKTIDKSFSAQYEYTVLVTNNGYKILK